MATLTVHPYRQPSFLLAFLVAVAVSFFAGARLGPAFLGGARIRGAPPAVACEVQTGSASTGPGSIGVAEAPEIGPDCNTNVQ